MLNKIVALKKFMGEVREVYAIHVALSTSIRPYTGEGGGGSERGLMASTMDLNFSSCWSHVQWLLVRAVESPSKVVALKSPSTTQGSFSSPPRDGEKTDLSLPSWEP